MGLTYKQKFNKRYKKPVNSSNTLNEISKLTKIPMRVIRIVYNRGVGAHKTNLKSVRLKKTFKKNIVAPASKKLSKEQWAYARVYAFIMKSKNKLNHDMDLITFK
jgi:hypothetical protein